MYNIWVAKCWLHVQCIAIEQFNDSAQNVGYCVLLSCYWNSQTLLQLNLLSHFQDFYVYF